MAETTCEDEETLPAAGAAVYDDELVVDPCEYVDSWSSLWFRLWSLDMPDGDNGPLLVCVECGW